MLQKISDIFVGAIETVASEIVTSDTAASSQAVPFRQHTIAVDTLRNNLSAFRSYMRDEYGAHGTPQLPDLERAFDPFQSGERVPVENVSMSMTLLAEFIDEPNLGIKLAKYLEKSYTKEMLFFNQVAIRFIDYLHMIARYMRITTEIFEYDIAANASDIALTFIPISPDTISYQQTEGLCALLVRALRGHPDIAMTRIDFLHAKPSDDDAVYREAFSVLPRFGQGATRLYFPIECRDVLIMESDATEGSIRTLQNYETQLSRLSEDACLVERCEFLLPLLLCMGEANKTRLAELLCMSPRTFQRKLSEHKTSFREILQNVRIQLCQHYFIKTNASCTELCFALGYQDYKQFNRACNDWFGMSPEAFREQSMGGRPE